MTTTPAVGKITSGFGRRKSLIPGMSTNHRGVDIGIATGTLVVAPLPGVVTVSAYNAARGHYVVVDHGGGWATLHQHLSRRDVAVGDRVAEGDRLGLSGRTGTATGPHLHTEVHDHGTPIDPVPWYLARGVILGSPVRIVAGRPVTQTGDPMLGIVVIANRANGRGPLPYALYTGGGHYQELDGATWPVVGDLLRKGADPASIDAVQVIDLRSDADGGERRYALLHAALAHHGPSW